MVRKVFLYIHIHLFYITISLLIFDQKYDEDKRSINALENHIHYFGYKDKVRI
jgi:hypothetical protein